MNREKIFKTFVSQPFEGGRHQKRTNKIKTKKIFKWLKQNNIEDNEMLKTFNCGVGFCLIISPKNLDKVKKYFTKEFKPYVIGKISKGRNKVKLNGSINWI